MSPLSILLVDDSPVFLLSVSRFLSMDERLSIVGCVLSGEDAVEEVQRSHPDVVLMDIAMPIMNGWEATRLIKAQPKPPYIVILSSNDSREYHATSVAVGADSFIPKSEIAIMLKPLLLNIYSNHNHKF
ncbi:response regulator transcription factor [Iningainema sp. BLCCT55]|uniref:Response regulator transcription factor n=2 Tax=Iningainema TaxID=1932705 RepID=A0A8J6XMU1_9CYAN|nr:response regulator transcription factor [Iningainema tapete BLCC-T55]